MTTWTKLWTNNWNVDIDTLNSAEINEFIWGVGGIADTSIAMHAEGKLYSAMVIFSNDRKTRQRYFLDQASADSWDAFVKARINQYNLQSYWIGTTIEDVNFVTD